MRGNSYKRDSMGRYSRDDGYSRRNYSRADESEHAIEQLEEMLKTAGGESEDHHKCKQKRKKLLHFFSSIKKCVYLKA